MRVSRVCFVACMTLAGPAFAAPPRPLRIVPMDTEPPEGRARPSDAEIEHLKKDVADAPEDRARRFALVRGLEAAGKLDDAVEAARAWRAHDAYNLVVVRLLGDLYTEQGKKTEARRAYSAIVELSPKDAESQRALATVLKQSGDLDGAADRLESALRIHPDDVRLAFELADVEHRLGREADAEKRFASIVEKSDAPAAVTYPAKQRLGQIYAGEARAAEGRGAKSEAASLEKKIDGLALHGGTSNDLKAYLSWDTDRTDIDLWVETPSKEKVFYGHKNGKGGEALFDDVTTGYGPESFTAARAAPGTYLVKVNYYGTSRQTFTEARGEVIVIVHEGTAAEQRVVLPYRLFQRGQTVTVARVEVGS